MTLRELRYIIYGEDRLSNKLKKINAASTKTSSALNNTSRKISGAKAMFKGLAKEFPAVGKGMSMLTSPAGIAVGAVVAVGAVLNKAIDSASEFNATFRELENMNLSKPESEIKRLRNNILSLSFEKGFDANKASTGFYDVQSITGKYGAEVERIVTKQGKFAQVMRANFNEWIAGSAKAMANYGFGAKELDRYNASAAATIQVGVMTYDQYAKVSSVFAGSASAAKQSYDSSNKLFAMFTKKTKSVDEAATLTKSAFTDLYKPATIKAFKKVGINLFDIHGGAKQVDVIMKELNAKFAGVGNDRAMTALRNQFKGSEGLIALINAASDQSGDFLRTIEEFNKAKDSFSFSAALKKYNKDLASINDRINSKMKAAWIGLGEAILPVWIPIKKAVVGLLDSIKELFDFVTGNSAKKFEGAEFQRGQDYVRSRYKKEIATAKSMSDEQYKATIVGITKKIASQQKNVEASEKVGDVMLQNKKGQLKGYYDVLDKLGKARLGIKDKERQSGITETGSPAIDPSTPDATVDKGLESVSGGGARVRSIKVDINKLVENINLQATTVKEGVVELREIIQEELIRAVRGFEQSMG